VTRFATKAFGRPPTTLPRVSFGELVRALAHHYGFPTFFVDLTLEPLVAAFFATYEYMDGRYVVRESEPSVVYRRPARRASSVRLQIPVEQPRGDGVSAVNAIDLTKTSRYVRRPHNRTRVLATPVSRPVGPTPVRPVGCRKLGFACRLALLGGG
jgi:FRG domain